MKYIVVLLLALPVYTAAQKNHSSFNDNRVAISFSPLALAQVDYTLLAGFEYKLASRFFLSGEAGYIFASDYVNNIESANNATGFIIRPSVKWFATENNKFYLQPQVFYKQVTHKMYDWLGKDPVNGVPAYEELKDFRYRRTVTGINLVAGFVLPLDRRSRGFADLYFGLGVRNKKNMVMEPNAIYIRQVGIFNPTDEGVYPSVPVGIRFIYALY